MRPETAPWLRQAEADLETARINPDADRYSAASWFSQQAAEKGLKAVYLEREGKEAPRIHDLESLAEEVDAPPEIDQAASAVNPAFRRVRYPDLIGGPPPVDAVNDEEAKTHLEAAQRVMTWVRQRLT